MRVTVDPVLFSEFAKEIRNLSPTGPTERELQNFLLAPVIRLHRHPDILAATLTLNHHAFRALWSLEHPLQCAGLSRRSLSPKRLRDPLVFVTVPILLSLIALLAVWMPATHASRLDPQEALRIE